MLSFSRTKKVIEVTKPLCNVKEKGKMYRISWWQFVSSKGKVEGTGSFRQQKNKGKGNWGETLKNRIHARREKEKEREKKK